MGKLTQHEPQQCEQLRGREAWPHSHDNEVCGPKYGHEPCCKDTKQCHKVELIGGVVDDIRTQRVVGVFRCAHHIDVCTSS
jgi:hypothetical protein